MAIVVGGVMHRLDVGEAHAADDEHAEQGGGEDRHGARQVRAATALSPAGLVASVVILIPHAPSTRGRG